MDLRRIMIDFTAIPQAVIGRGPLHPTAPDVRLSDAIAEYVDQYPFLGQQQQYLNFVRAYAGARISSCGLYPHLWVEIFGVGPFYEEESLLGLDGYFCFSTCTIDYDPRRVVCTEYLFDSNSCCEGPIYLRQSPEDGVRRAYSSYFEWLATLVDTRGFMPPQHGVDTAR